MSLHDHSISESRDVVFFENNFSLKKSSINIDIHLDEYVSSSSTQNRNTFNDDMEPRRSKRQRTVTSFRPDFLTSFVIEISYLDLISDSIAHAFLIDKDIKIYD